MAIISPDSFDPLRRYVSVRLAQGVPLVDADWNESDDIRRFELRAFIRWFVGDGVPFGNDGFRIEAANPPTKTDFVIKAGGDAAPLTAGRMFVDGLEAFILADIMFTAQPLHAGQPGAAALAARWGVPVIAPVAPAGQNVTIFLDVWERLVTSAEEPSLILAGLGTESCARLRREWAVRVRDETAQPGLPKPGDPDHRPGHSYAALALADREDGDGFIIAEWLFNKRRTGLQLSSRRNLDQLVADTFGRNYELIEGGQPQLTFPLRDIINAIIRERPAILNARQHVVGGQFNIGSAFETENGTVRLFWIRANGPSIFLAGTSTSPVGEAPPAQDLFQFQGVIGITSLAVASQDSGVMRAFYTGQAGTSKLFSRRFDGTAWAAPEEVGSPDANSAVSAVTIGNSDIQIAWVAVLPGAPAQIVVQTRTFPADGSAPSPITTVGTTTDPQARVAVTGGADDVQVFLLEQSGGSITIKFKETFLSQPWPAAWTTLGTLAASNIRELAATKLDGRRLFLAYILANAAGGTSLFGRFVESGVLGDERMLQRGASTGTGGPRFPAVVKPIYPNVFISPNNVRVFFQYVGLEEVGVATLI